MEGTTIQEITALREEFNKELGRIKEQARAERAMNFQFRAQVKVDLEILQNSLEWLEDMADDRLIRGEYAAVSQKLDKMMERVH